MCARVTFLLPIAAATGGGEGGVVRKTGQDTLIIYCTTSLHFSVTGLDWVSEEIKVSFFGITE